MNIERRTFPVELRVEKREDKTKIVGHASVFNTLSVDLGGFREEVAPGAFAETIKNDDIRGLWNHDPNFVLSRNTSGTMTLAEDERGLSYVIDAPQTQLIRDMVLSPIERGDVSQNSISFTVLPNGQQWREDENGQLIRRITNMKLYDVSPVTFAAYPVTELSLRSLEQIAADTQKMVIEARAILAAQKPPVFDPWELDLRQRRLNLATL